MHFRNRPDERRRERRFPRRWLVLCVLLAAVVTSERWGGPLTIAAIGNGTARITEAAATRLSPDAAPGSAGEIHLTFDDGPHLTFTPQVLEVLAEHDALAVFFPIGNQVPGGAALLRRTVAEGHRIGNHTWDHDTLRDIDDASFERVVGKTQDAIEHASGVTPRCLRPPGGAVDDETTARAAARQLSISLWTVDPSDWERPGASEIVDRVLARVGDGDVVLLHDGGGDRTQTVEALDDLLDELSSRGYLFTLLPGC